ncbi:MAG: alpha/beta fold hydrolase [Acidimicrobiaceae bacterium]|nr:alpha/beta fold hydrolase [Acidimicrobiaceae bacterium]
MFRRSPLLLLLLPLFLALMFTATSCSNTAALDSPVPEVAADAERSVVPEPASEPEPTARPTTAPRATAEPESDADPEVEIYDAPGDLELVLPVDASADPGTIIDIEELDIAGAFGSRILYRSTSAQGEAIAVSGFVMYPDDEPPVGGWPLIAWAHGTTGLGDSCAPSNEAENDQLAQALVGFGYAVVATDYEGLGTPGVHPYVVGASEAHSVLDSVRAVYELGLPVTDEWVVFGHSQGGHAAMFTGQLQSTYAPELNMIGVVAGAPPSQLGELNDALIGGDFQGYLVMTAAGLVAANDDLDMADVLSAEAIDLLDVVETGCTEDIFNVYNPFDYDAVAIVNDPFELADWGNAVRVNDTNLLPVLAPLLIIHGGEDEQIPVETSATLLDQLCAFEDQGPTVRNVYEGQSHAGILTTFAAVPDLLAWVGGRFAGEPAPDMCAP